MAGLEACASSALWLAPLQMKRSDSHPVRAGPSSYPCEEVRSSYP